MADQVEGQWRAYLSLGAGLLLLGFSAIFVSLAEAPGSINGFYRMAFGSLFLLIPVLRQSKGIGSLSKRGIGFALLAGAFFGADVAAWASGVTISGPTMPTLFANTNPIWVGIGAWWFFKERLDRSFWIGLAAALIGAAIILGVDFQKGQGLDAGLLLGLLASFFYGGFFLVAQLGRKEVPALSFFWLSTFSSAVILLIVNLLLGIPLSGYSTNSWIYFLAQGIMIQGGGWLLVSYAQGYLPASIVSPTLLIQPVLTALIAAVLLSENLGSGDLFGGSLLLAGIFIIHRGRTAKSKAGASRKFKEANG